ncbi:hypothetical protein C8J57DRAFT_1474884 [Mycena rebaudengoi]|nr:hypothetical protein C8J57DRAFT_1474884 [Mycena rebaudengoi]
MSGIGRRASGIKSHLYSSVLLSSTSAAFAERISAWFSRVDANYRQGRPAAPDCQPARVCAALRDHRHRAILVRPRQSAHEALAPRASLLGFDHGLERLLLGFFIMQGNNIEDKILRDFIPKATAQAAAFCEVTGITSIRFCLTDGRKWIFCVFVKDERGERVYEDEVCVILEPRFDGDGKDAACERSVRRTVELVRHWDNLVGNTDVAPLVGGNKYYFVKFSSADGSKSSRTHFNDRGPAYLDSHRNVSFCWVNS